MENIKIGIQDTPIGFTKRWIEYCNNNNIDYKLVDCYKVDIIKQMEDCDALMWHHDLILIKDNLIAKRLLFALEHSGKVVFPDFYCEWHYDDKIAQKYLLEAINAPLVPTHIFYDKNEALQWVQKTNFPKVIKLKGGAGSANVKLVHSSKQANKLINKAFGKGFSPVNKMYYLNESLRNYTLNKIGIVRLFKNFIRFFLPVNNNFVNQKENNYIYFQDFIPNNKSDIRLVVINQNRAFGLERFNRENDFRASGSGNFNFLKNKDIDLDLVKMAFDVSKKLKMDSVAYDIVFDFENKPQIVEITYAFVSKAYNDCPGCWDDKLNWIEGKLENYQHWMIERVIERIKMKNSTY